MADGLIDDKDLMHGPISGESTSIENINDESFDAQTNQKVYDTPHQVDHLVEVVDIYFAEKVPKFKLETKEEEYTIASKGTIQDVAKKYEKNTRINITVTPIGESKTTYTKGDKLMVRWEEKIENGFDYPKITKSTIKKKVYVVVLCNGISGKLNVEIHENKLDNSESVYENPIKFLIGEEEKTKVEFSLDGSVQYTQEIILRPKSDEDLKLLVDKFQNRDKKNAFLYFKAEVTDTEDEVKYSADSQEFLNQNNQRFEILGTPCYCNRDITVDEFKAIIAKMRDSENIKSKDIFTSSNCTLSDDEKSYEKLTEIYNKVLERYEINTCIRKIHFFAQSYWEADRFKTTLEYSSGEYLNPDQHDDAKSNGNTEDGDGPRYKGRGLMQLTWRNAYESYYNYLESNFPETIDNKKAVDLLDRSESYEETYYYTETDPKTKKKIPKSKIYKVDGASLVASKIELSVDSAGWFWKEYKKSKKGHNLNYYSDYGDTYVDFISTLVNGGGNGKSNRKTYYEKLRDEIFKLKDNCVNYENIKKEK
jgi:predicted chitinase